MSLLIFGYRKLDIIHRKNELNYRLMELTRKLSDLQQYSANIADGSVSMHDMTNTPGSMFGRQMMFMNYAHNAALFGAQQNMAYMQPQIQMQMQQMQDPNQQMMYQNWIFQSLYKQQREQVAKQEAKLLNAQEKEIEAEKQKIQTQLQLLEQEYGACVDGEKKSLEMFKPEYA